MDIRREILRNIILCQALEPLGKKPGVLSPYGETSSGARLESFIIAAVNSSWPFYDLVDRVLAEKKQPDSIFDTAYEAQSASARNHRGRVNYGQIYLLVPLVAAQALEYLKTETFDDVEAILERTGEVLRNTTEKDVESLEKFIQQGYDLATRQHEDLGRTKKPRTPAAFKGRYSTIWEAAHDYQNIPAVREVTEGYPHSERVYRFLLHNLEDGILPATDLIYRLLLTETGRPDVAADLIVCGIYLVLTRHPEATVFS